MDIIMINIQIITPDKIIINDQTKYITVPTEYGEIQILKNHTPLISKLSEGVIYFPIKNNKTSIKKMKIDKGFIEINEYSVTILVENIEIIK